MTQLTKTVLTLEALAGYGLSQMMTLQQARAEAQLRGDYYGYLATESSDSSRAFDLLNEGRRDLAQTVGSHLDSVKDVYEEHFWREFDDTPELVI